MNLTFTILGCGSSGGVPRPGTGWGAAALEEVAANLATTGYPAENLVFVKGKVEETVPVTR